MQYLAHVTITADDMTDLANFDITITYDPAVVIVTGTANNGAFGSSMNNLDGAASGTVRLMSFNTGSGQTGSDILLSTLTLKAVGTATQTSTLNLTINSLMNSAEGDITATLDNGVFTVTVADTPVILKGDINGDGILSSVDALMALQMAAGNIAQNLVADVSGDGNVTSLDALMILQASVGAIVL